VTVAALFVDDSLAGIYPRLIGASHCYGVTHARDARTYAGPHPVVAHPPCNLWVNMAAQNYARASRPCPNPRHAEWGAKCPVCKGTGRREPNRSVVLPAWYEGGDDDGRFAAALRAVRTYGGVLEHPASTHAWDAHAIARPIGYSPARRDGWTSCHFQAVVGESQSAMPRYWVCEVWQSAYGHAARKRTWLLYCGKRPPFELRWERPKGTHQIGWFDRIKPTVSKREASATPEAFARELVRLAEWSRGA
jgi:hypothetical protein